MCDQCPYKAKTRYSAKTHKQNNHDDDGLRHRYQCHQCDYMSKENRNLVQHIKSKHGEVKKCEHCDHEANTELLLKKHISTMKKYNEQSHQ